MAPALAARTELTREAEQLVRDPSLFKWYAPSSRQRWGRVGALAALDFLMALVFGVGLGWL